jgi:dolichyl-phosphate beta-glucosyltransferase
VLEPNLQAYIALIVLTPTTLPRSASETFYLSAKNPSNPLPLTPISEDATLSLSIVVPAYNERERLGIMVDEAMGYISGLIHGTDEATSTANSKASQGVQTIPRWLELGAELIIVDDGSRDDTAQVALSLASRWDKAIQARINGSPSGRTEMKDLPTLEMRVVKLEKNRGKGGAVRHVSLELKMRDDQAFA